MDLLQLEHLLAVAEEGNFTRAAERLCRTQPAVSQSIKKLEDEVGTTLFTRDVHEVALTEAGRMLADYARRMVGLRDDALRRMRGISNLDFGNLTIAAHESAAVYLLPGPVRRFLECFPQIKVGIRRSRLDEIPRQVMDREVDIGFLKEAPAFHELQSVMVHADEMILIASPRRPLASRERVSVRDLGDEAFVVHHLCSSTEQQILRLFKAHGMRCKIAAELWSFENVKHFVRQDVGLAIVPKVCVAEELADGSLTEIPVEGLDMPRQTFMAFRDQDHLPQPALQFIDIIRQFSWDALGAPRERTLAPAQIQELRRGEVRVGPERSERRAARDAHSADRPDAPALGARGDAHRRSAPTSMHEGDLMSAALNTLALVLALAGEAVPPSPAVSELRDAVEDYSTDRSVLLRRYPVERSPKRLARLERFHEDWRRRLAAIDFERLGLEGRVDYVLLRNEVEDESKLLRRYERSLSETGPLVPFAAAIVSLNDARLELETLDAARAASALDALAQQVETVRKAVEAGLKPDGDKAKSSASPAPAAPRAPIKATALEAFRAQEALESLKKVLESWYQYYAGYDPLFTWWASAPYKKASQALDDYRKLLRDKVLDIKPQDDEPIVGRPIGRDALVADLAAEFIPYTPEDLLAIADVEFAWCEAEMKKAARDMGLGDDWKAALEKVKTLHVEPGKQPDLIRDLAREAEAFLEQRDLITVPPLAKEVWRMEMMTPERQKVNPFFTGGEVMSVSFPTDGMSQDDKLMSMRGNNVHFARATVFHELIPGHHLQGFMNARYNPHRRAFRTPFWTEGWALYWEMLLWDLGFPQTPENRIGMLFWRMHRAARIVFSLRFHLGTMTPQECIDFLVDRVGHERANAAAEVRRSFNGSYPPLYQLAYMMGGLQFKALHRELVDSGRMTNRDFHDAVMTGGPMPVELVRARLLKQTLTRDYQAHWRYAGEQPAAKH